MNCNDEIKIITLFLHDHFLLTKHKIDAIS